MTLPHVSKISPPQESDIGKLLSSVEDFKSKLLQNSGSPRSQLPRFGWLILDHLGLRTEDILTTKVESESLESVFEKIARSYLEHVLPTAEDISKFDTKQVTEYLAALNTERPDPGRLSAAFGEARLPIFGKDLRLVYRTGGYRGKPGNLLADYLISKTVQPVIAPMPGTST